MKQDLQFLLENEGHLYDRLNLFFKTNTTISNKGKLSIPKKFSQRWDDVINHLYRTQFRLTKEYKSFALLTNEECVKLLEEALTE